VAGRHPDPGREPVSILLAEHEPEVAEMSARYLRRDGLRVRLVTTPELTLAELTGGSDAAAVIDLTMPGLDPRRIRRALRTPVIFLVADTKAPRPRGLAGRGGTAGARRWLTRPFSPRQLVALVREVLADSGEPHPPGPPLAHPGGTFSPHGGAPRPPVPPWPPGSPLEAHLTATESAVLAALANSPGRVLSRRQLLAAAGCQGVGDRAADVYIAQLRAKLAPAVRIRTVRGTGYVLDQPSLPSESGGGPIPGGQSQWHPGGRATIGGATVPM
jgi:DNA-binding response OmpR family regulator